MLRHSLPTACLLLLAAACSDEPTGSSVLPDAAAKPGGPSDPTATWKIPLNDTGLGLASDGLYPSGAYSVYANGVCGVSAKIFATTAASNTGDATILTNKTRNCTRKFRLRYPDGGEDLVPSHNNLLQLQSTGYSIPIGQTVRRRLIVAPGALANNSSRCGRLLFGPNGAVSAGSDSVQVTRVDASTWQVQSESGHNLATCESNDSLYAMSVSFTVVSSSPL